MADNAGKELLTDEETHRLLRQVQEGNAAAREALVRSNLRLVASIVQRFGGRDYEYEDLFQVGCIGLLKAIDRFDFRYGVKFSTYAVSAVIGEIRRFLRDDSPVRVSRSLKETAARANRVREALANRLGREPTLTEVAAAVGLPAEEVVAACEAAQLPASLQDIVYGEGSDAIRREEQIAGVTADENAWLQRIAVRDLLSRLPKKERQVLVWRFYEDMTQAEIAAQLGISQAQVSRIERQALQRLQEAAGEEF
ncbi:SigB/SigF/SigG family RNA polymerase sigma factor [Thermodesulfitimonas autotrophica]|uniref:SigB/SigF/SigG family RNA polymerase sigma factor n=1 Tax=Thermodesulfitimonas autotrophica TaxID=1894989 RepID=UPI002FE02C17